MSKGTRIDGMNYQGRWANYNYANVTSWVPNAFRAPNSRPGRNYHRPAVRGGRWFVRRTPNHPDRPWRAWTNGKAKMWSRYFEDHETAIQWAHLVAETYRKYDDEHAASILGLMLRYPK